MFKVILSMSDYQEKIAYERNFLVILRKDKRFGLGDYTDVPFYFETIEKAEEIIKCFCNGDFSYAFIEDENDNSIKVYYIRTEMRLS